MTIFERALEMVTDHSHIGLGSGRAACAFVKALGDRIRHGALHVYGVPTSKETERLAMAEDIPLLARYFTSKYARRMNKHIKQIAPETLGALTRYHWPGNVRELQNYIERAVILAKDAQLRTPPPEAKSNGNTAEAVDNLRNTTLREAERRHIVQALRQSNWVVGGPTGAAARLGMKRTSLLYRMEKLGISRQSQG